GSPEAMATRDVVVASGAARVVGALPGLAPRSAVASSGASAIGSDARVHDQTIAAMRSTGGSTSSGRRGVIGLPSRQPTERGAREATTIAAAAHVADPRVTGSSPAGRLPAPHPRDP